MTFQGAPSLAKSEDDMKRADDKPSSDAQPIALKIICPPPEVRHITLRITYSSPPEVRHITPRVTYSSPPEVRHITPRIVRGTPPSCPWSDLMKGNKKQNGSE